MNASRNLSKAEIEITRTVQIDRAKLAGEVERARGNAALAEARTLARYRGADNELTKPSVVLMDWVGDDEVTVRWETVRREAPPVPFESEIEPPNFRGVGARAGGLMLGVVLGIAVTIGLLALLGAGASAAATAPLSAAVVVPQAAVQAPPVAAPVVTPVAPAGGATVTNAVSTRPAVAVSQRAHRPRTLLNVDATERANAIVDGRPIGTTPQRISVAPGEHTIVIVHPTLGRRTFTVDAMKDRVTFATAKF